jgi:hypothetical protein
LSFKPPLTPSNVAQFYFALQLVIIPLLILTSGVAMGQLPTMPSRLAINLGLLISTLAYIGFSVAYDRSVGYFYQAKPEGFRGTRYPLNHTYWLVAIFFILGLVGYYLFSGDLRGYLNYIGSPSYRLSSEQSLAGSLAGSLSTFLKPFLGFSIILGWCLWVDKHRFSSKGALIIVLTLFVAVLLVFVNLGFYFNRGAVAAPIFALGAAFMLRVRRAPTWVIALVSIVVLFGLIILRPYRQSGLRIYDLTRREQVKELLANYSLPEDIQVYGGAPQFSGFLIEETGWGLHPYWGRTLLASILYPLPGWGKIFRPDSGVALYNNLIYQDPRIMDQVVPFAGELFINFHVFGLLAGFGLVGMIIAKLQRAFLHAQNTFEAYVIFLLSVWVAFLIPGSIAVTSQILMFSLWPVYAYWGIRKLRQVKSLKRAEAPARLRGE